MRSGPGSRASPLVKPPIAALAVSHRLRGEELVAQIGIHPVLPVFGRHGLDLMAVIVAGVVDERQGRAVPLSGHRHSGFQGVQIGQVAFQKQRPLQPKRYDAARQGFARLPLNIEKGHSRLLRGKMLDDALANTGCTAGNQDGPAFQAGIGRIRRCHAALLNRTEREASD
jgi:hypothetical protein